MDIKLKVGQRIRELRRKLELSQEGLANEAEVDRTYVTDVENGRRNISVEVLERIIAALKVSFFDFFNSKEFKKTHG
jgi:transcriptional regulator with XRE-family HTH domain